MATYWMMFLDIEQDIGLVLRVSLPPVLSADDLELREESGDNRVVTCRDLHPDTTWGPYPGILQSEGNTADQETEVGALVLTVQKLVGVIYYIPL